MYSGGEDWSSLLKLRHETLVMIVTCYILTSILCCYSAKFCCVLEYLIFYCCVLIFILCLVFPCLYYLLYLLMQVFGFLRPLFMLYRRGFCILVSWISWSIINKLLFWEYWSPVKCSILKSCVITKCSISILKFNLIIFKYLAHTHYQVIDPH